MEISKGVGPATASLTEGFHEYRELATTAEFSSIVSMLASYGETSMFKRISFQ